jgi:hypothetical protein
MSLADNSVKLHLFIFSDLQFLEEFKNLTSVILDHNKIPSEVEFPMMPNVTLLWLNYNNIQNLYPFIRNLRAAFPMLKQLSLMGNPVAPPCREDTFYDYLQYRLFVISWLQNLEHLDDRSVTQDEREEALRLYKRPLLERMQSISLPKLFHNTFSSIKELVGGSQASNQPQRYNSLII